MNKAWLILAIEPIPKSLLLFGVLLLCTPSTWAANCSLTLEQDQNGDGYDDALVAPSAQLGAYPEDDVMVDCSASIGARSRIIFGSKVYASGAIGSDSQVTRSTVGIGGVVGNNTRVEDSRVEYFGIVADTARVYQSNVVDDAYVGFGSYVYRSFIGEYGVLDEGVRAYRSSVQYADIRMGTRLFGASIVGEPGSGGRVLIGSNSTISQASSLHSTSRSLQAEMIPRMANGPLPKIA